VPSVPKAEVVDDFFAVIGGRLFGLFADVVGVLAGGASGVGASGVVVGGFGVGGFGDGLPPPPPSPHRGVPSGSRKQESPVGQQ